MCAECHRKVVVNPNITQSTGSEASQSPPNMNMHHTAGRRTHALIVVAARAATRTAPVEGTTNADAEARAEAASRRLKRIVRVGGCVHIYDCVCRWARGWKGGSREETTSHRATTLFDPARICSEGLRGHFKTAGAVPGAPWGLKSPVYSCRGGDVLIEL